MTPAPDQPNQPNEELRAHRRGVLRVDDRPLDVRFVLDGASGLPALPLGRDEREAENLVLCLPDDRFDCFELLVEPRDFETESTAELCRDRFLAYHRRVDGGEFGLFGILSARLGAEVWDEEEAVRPNPLSGDEPALCKALNADRAALAALTAHLGRVGGRAFGRPVEEPDEPLCVGVDDTGADVRTRFDVVRLTWPRPVTDHAAAEVLIDGLLRAEGGDLTL